MGQFLPYPSQSVSTLVPQLSHKACGDIELNLYRLWYPVKMNRNSVTHPNKQDTAKKAVGWRESVTVQKVCFPGVLGRRSTSAFPCPRIQGWKMIILTISPFSDNSRWLRHHSLVFTFYLKSLLSVKVFFILNVLFVQMSTLKMILDLAEYSVKLAMYLLVWHSNVGSITIPSHYFLFEVSSPLHCWVTSF